MNKTLDWFIDSPIRFYLLALLTLLPIVGILDYYFIKDWSDVLVEVHGLIFDLLILGILFTIYSTIKERKDNSVKAENERQLKVHRYQEEIDDFRDWNDQEAMFRIAGNIKRLNSLGVTNINLYNCKLKNIKLRSAELIDSNLSGADLGKGYLRNINLTDSILIRVYFGDVNLRGATLLNVNLERARLERANMVGVNMQNSNCEKTLFYDTNLQSADMRNCDFKNSDFTGTILSSAKLYGAKNLTVDQLLKAKSLKSIGIEPNILHEIQMRNPSLLHV